MRIFNRFRGTKGWFSTWERVVRFRDMISEQAKRKARILTFWENHGYMATFEAFGVKQRTLFDWKRKLKLGRGKLESLNDASRSPKTRRKRRWSPLVIEEIKRIRYAHPNIGKEKLYPLLKNFELRNPATLSFVLYHKQPCICA